MYLLSKLADSLILPVIVGFLVALIPSLFPRMKSRPKWQRWAVFLTLFLVGTAVIYVAIPKAQEEDAVIAGTVRDESNGAGIGGVQIAIDGRTEHCISDDTGNFRIKLMPNPKPNSGIKLTARKPGYDPLNWNVVSPQHNLQLMLQKVPR